MQGVSGFQIYLMSMLSSICFVLIIFTAMSKSLTRRRRILLLHQEAASVVIMLFERGAYVFSGDTSDVGYIMVRICNFMSYAMPYVLTFFYVNFVYDYMKEEGGLVTFPKTLMIIEALNITGVVTVILSQVNYFYYTFDASNVYQRTNNYAYSYILPAIIFPLMFYSIFHNGKGLSRQQRLLLLMYCIIPFVSIAVQPFLFGLSMVNISMVIPIILIFTVHLLEMDRKAKETNELKIRQLNEKQNITQEKLNQSYEDLTRALEDANAANVAKTEFLSNISHDIRTPMNAIIGYADIALRHENDRDKVSDCLAKISVASDQLMTLISDVLDMTKIEKGHFEFREETIHLQAAVNNVVSMFSSSVDEKHINFHVDVSGLVHDKVVCDSKVINRILMNIISNSVKFTGENGTISLSVEDGKEFEKEGTRNYRFTFTDNGIGMSEEFLQKIYEPFERAQSATLSHQKGAGLGMAIVKNLVDHLGGKIHITSHLGLGTTVIIDLPLKQVVEEAPKEKIAIVPGSLEGRTVLLVDDMAINREIACMILEERNMIVEQAENGLEAVEMYKQNPQKYDAILMDIQMPVMNGLQATETIRSLEKELDVRIPILAMTADAFAADKLKAIHAGMDDHISKPIDIGKLFTALSKYIR
ncbi:Signal transduction histidine kinase [Lachnospiraceae bacterium C10]|nr:Signal transduction histidine kinase [Lachnospiraceae bacterium C10]